MGGQAILQIEGVVPKRLSVEEFLIFKDKISNTLDHFGITYKHIPYYRSKSSFGDLDVLICRDETWRSLSNNMGKFLKDFSNYIKETHGMNYQGMIKNTDIFSIAIDSFQMDLIGTSPEDMDTSMNYFSYNDLNNLLGRTYHKLGLKHSHKGLLYMKRLDNEHVVGQINLSKDWDKILEFGGFNVKKYREGFDTLEDIFQYAISTPYFDGTIFKFENLNNENRTRNVKRTTYVGFVKWLENNGLIEKTFPFHPKEFYQNCAVDYFNKRDEYNQLMAEFEKNKLISSKFNGNIISDLTGVKEKELGKFIVYIKNSEQNLSEFIYESDQMKINHFILKKYDAYYNKEKI